MEKLPYQPPKTDYAEKVDLLNAIHEMKLKMEPNKDLYEKKFHLMENIEIVSQRKSTFTIAILILCLLYRVMLTDDDSPFYSEKFLAYSFQQKVIATLIIMVVIPAVYYLLTKIGKMIKLTIYQNRLSDCDEQLKEIYNSYGPCPIGYKYAIPSFVDQIEEMLLDGRADTVKESINYILGDEQNAKLLDYQDQIARSGKQTAIATSITAFFAWRNARWSKKNYNETKKNNK